MGLEQQHRILVVGRRQEPVDAVNAVLEAGGYSVTATLHDDIAVDLAASSEFDALLTDGMTRAERSSLRGEVLQKLPAIKIVQTEGVESVLTLMKQALR